MAPWSRVPWRRPLSSWLPNRGDPDGCVNGFRPAWLPPSRRRAARLPAVSAGWRPWVPRRRHRHRGPHRFRPGSRRRACDPTPHAHGRHDCGGGAGRRCPLPGSLRLSALPPRRRSLHSSWDRGPFPSSRPPRSWLPTPEPGSWPGSWRGSCGPAWHGRCRQRLWPLTCPAGSTQWPIRRSRPPHRPLVRGHVRRDCDGGAGCRSSFLGLLRPSAHRPQDPAIRRSHRFWSRRLRSRPVLLRSSGELPSLDRARGRGERTGGTWDGAPACGAAVVRTPKHPASAVPLRVARVIAHPIRPSPALAFRARGSPGFRGLAGGGSRASSTTLDLAGTASAEVRSASRSVNEHSSGRGPSREAGPWASADRHACPPSGGARETMRQQDGIRTSLPRHLLPCW